MLARFLTDWVGLLLRFKEIALDEQKTFHFP